MNGRPFKLADLVDGADVGMIEGGGRAGFTAESLEGLRILGHVIGQKLKGDKTVQVRVFGLVHHAHAAAAQLLDDSIMRDDLTNHGKGAAIGGHLMAAV